VLVTADGRRDGVLWVILAILASIQLFFAYLQGAIDSSQRERMDIQSERIDALEQREELP
jgi:hypothetical protein